MAETADPPAALAESGGACRPGVVEQVRASRVVAPEGRWLSAEMPAADPVAPVSSARPVDPALAGKLRPPRAVTLAQVERAAQVARVALLVWAARARRAGRRLCRWA